MKSGCFLLAAGFLFFHAAAFAQDREIHLRNEIISTPPPGLNQAKSLVAEKPSSGLFLVQFNSAMEPAWRAQLKAAGIDLLKYVPDDAFITKFNNVSADTVRSFGFVRWVGPFKASHKIHPRLNSATKSLTVTNPLVAVNILLSPEASTADVTLIRSYFTRVTSESPMRQGTILRGELHPGFVDQIANSTAVLWIERAPRRKLVDEAAAKLVGGDDGQVATPTKTQQLGFNGQGVIVSVADTGLDTGDTNTMHPDLFGRVVGFKHYGNNIEDGSDGYGHGTHCAGIVAGNAATGETDPDTDQLYGLGVASGASIFVQRIFGDDASEADPLPSDATLTRDAVENGAVIGSNSWGNDTQGEYDTDSSQFDELVRDANPAVPGDQPYILEFSSGNAGPDSETVGSPATGKNVLTTGASQNQPGTLALTYGLYADGPDVMADFSSRGPCEDGRIKPDVVAPGTWIASAASAYADSAAVAWSPIDDYYLYMGGTSMSGPHAAGAAAVFVQYYRATHTNATPSPALVKAALINSAVELDQVNGGPGPIPNNEEGWGRVTLEDIITTNFSGAPRYFDYVDQSTLLTNGQEYVRHALVRSSAQPLKITLTYTDVAGFPGAIPALVNDLDLEVVAPDGTIYRGNQFAGSESVPNAPSADNLNNVEGVHLNAPMPGDYLIRVRGKHIVQDARLETASIDQDFALVVSADLTRPGIGAVLMDRQIYTAPGVIKLSVFDPVRAASNSVSVLLKSTTEPAGENYTLTAAGSFGSFTGAVATVIASASVDGKLQIHNGDVIEANYFDSIGVKRVALASADTVPPVITGVGASTDLGAITISWQTGEPSTSIVRYGTNLTFNLGVTNTALVTSHTVRLTKLVPGKTYFYYVVSADSAGNYTTNNNSGAYYSFVAVATPTVLLVDAYDTTTGGDDEDSGSAAPIDDGVYTNALNSAGFTYGFWKVTERGAPLLSDLQPFSVVIWRTTDDVINYTGTNNTLTAQQQFMIQDYLNGGGSFFMASMDILSRLGNVPFRKNVFQVAGFKQNSDPLFQCFDCDEDHQVPAIVGAAGNPISAGINVALDYSQYPSIDLDEYSFGPDFSDVFTPGTNATPIVFESASGKACGMSYPRVGVDSPGRVVFLSFPLDTVPTTGTAPNTESALLKKILTFLTPGLNGVATIALNNTVYSSPDQIVVEVADSDLARTGQTQVKFSASSSTNVVQIALNETTRPGLFRGVLTIAATSGTNNQLVVHNGDIVTAKYFDTSNNSNAVATALIDTIPPVITNVTSVSRFGDAIVTWKTSKPSDSLVQFGESVLLGRTAFVGDLVTNHVVNINALVANHNYVFQVTSRDAAGNVAIDDNHGLFYNFTTQKAPEPPYFDNFENDGNTWTVVPDPVNGTDRNWSLGAPANGVVGAAHSGTNVWGSNLDGSHFNFLASSFLYSPFIDLSGVSTATLTFWHAYDFSSGLENGQLGISTNSATPPGDIPTLATYSGADSGGWVSNSINLNAYCGKTIQVVWYYQGVDIGFGDAPAGWLLDDVRITGTAATTGGTITIVKNLGQGSFTLSGPVNRTGNATFTVISNVPAGPYTIQFSDVAFYQTPASQSNTLDSSSSLTFTGNYGFLDLNQNKISDSWEKFYFGSAGTNRTQFTDSDGDGMADYAEFIAGTVPTNALSKLVMLSTTILTNKHVLLQWAAIPGRLYQVQSSSGLSGQASSTAKVSGAMLHPANSFKLHIETPAGNACVIQVSTNLTSWTSIYTNAAGGTMDYTDSQAASLTRRFYRTLVTGTPSAPGGAGWTPISDWIQATGSPMTFTTTNAPQNTQFYRVQVRP